MPRQRKRDTSPETRFRNMLEAEGRPALAGLSRIGPGGGVASALMSSAVLDGPVTDESTSAGTAKHLVLSATGDSIASGGDYVAFGAVVTSFGFDRVTPPTAGNWVHPTTGVYIVTVRVGWSTYDASATDTVELELDGAIPDGGLIISGGTGRNGSGTVSYYAEAGQVGRVKVTQSSGSAQTCDASLWLAITDPATTSACLVTAFSDTFNSGAASSGWSSTSGAISLSTGPDGTHCWDLTGATNLVYDAPARFQTNRWVLTCDYYQSANTGGLDDHILMGRDGSPTQIKTDIDTDGSVRVTANGVRLTSPPGTVQLGVWQRWEIDATLSESAGAMRLTIDGAVIYDGVGINTGFGPFGEFILSVTSGGTVRYDNAFLTVDTCS